MEVYNDVEVVPAIGLINQGVQTDAAGNVLENSASKLQYNLVVEGPKVYIQTAPTDIGGGPKIYRLAALKTQLVLKVLMEPEVVNKLIDWHNAGFEE